MIANRYTLKDGKLESSETGELVRAEDFDALDRKNVELRDELDSLRKTSALAVQHADDELMKAREESRGRQAVLEKLRRVVCEAVPGPALAPEKIDELARDMVTRLQKTIAASS